MTSRSAAPLLLVAGLSACAAGLYQGDAQRTGRASAAGPASWKKRWVVEGDFGNYRCASCAVARDGSVFAVGGDPSGMGYALHAFDTAGKPRWACALPEDSWASPAVTPDGGVLAGLLDGSLVRVAPDGKIAWSFETGGAITSSPAIAEDGTIYMGSRSDSLFAVSPEGKQLWTFRTGGWVDAAPAIGTDGTVYVASWDRSLYALSPDGDEKWRFATGRPISACPVVCPDAGVLVASEDGTLYALGADGKERWRYETKGWIPFSPCVDASGNVVFASNDGVLRSLGPDGKERWTSHVGQPQSNLLCDARGVVYLVADSKLLAVDATGKTEWVREQMWTCALTMGDDGALFVQTTQMLWAIEP